MTILTKQEPASMELVPIEVIIKEEVRSIAMLNAHKSENTAI
jgi:hypothetical protein